MCFLDFKRTVVQLQLARTRNYNHNQKSPQPHHHDIPGIFYSLYNFFKYENLNLHYHELQVLTKNTTTSWWPVMTQAILSLHFTLSLPLSSLYVYIYGGNNTIHVFLWRIISGAWGYGARSKRRRRKRGRRRDDSFLTTKLLGVLIFVG